jgi:hypothetical protein
MLHSLRTAKPDYATRNPNPINTDMLIEGITYNSLGSHRGIALNHAP